MTPEPAVARSTLAPSARVLHRATLDGVVLLNLDGGDPVLLTGPGASLWAALETGPVRRDDLVATVAAEYRVEPGLVAGDLEGVVDQLHGLGVVVVVSQRGADAGG